MTLFSNAPANIGVHDGRLADCPNTPNCVSSAASDQAKRVDPLPTYGDADQAMTRLKQVVARLPRAKVVHEADGYLHVECRSRFWRFVDDLEFLFDGDQGVVHIRSAARLGRGDLGVNRRRVEQIQRWWAEGAD